MARERTPPAPASGWLAAAARRAPGRPPRGRAPELGWRRPAAWASPLAACPHSAPPPSPTLLVEQVGQGGGAGGGQLWRADHGDQVPPGQEGRARGGLGCGAARAPRGRWARGPRCAPRLLWWAARSAPRAAAAGGGARARAARATNQRRPPRAAPPLPQSSCTTTLRAPRAAPTSRPWWWSPRRTCEWRLRVWWVVGCWWCWRGKSRRVLPAGHGCGQSQAPPCTCLPLPMACTLPTTTGCRPACHTRLARAPQVHRGGRRGQRGGVGSVGGPPGDAGGLASNAGGLAWQQAAL